MTQGIRLDRMQRALTAFADRLVAAGVVDGADWMLGQKPGPAVTSWLTLELSSGPGTGLRIGPWFDKVVLPADTIAIRVTAAIAGNRPWLALNGFEHWYDVQAGDTDSDIRDAFIASINTEHADECTATIRDANELLLTANFLGGIWWLNVRGDLLAGDDTYSDRMVGVVTGGEPATLTLNAYSKDRTVMSGARSILTRAAAELRKRSTVNDLHRYGVALRDRGPIVPLDAVAGAEWETRCALDVGMSLESYIVEEVNVVESAGATVTIYDAPGGTPIPTTILASPP